MVRVNLKFCNESNNCGLLLGTLRVIRPSCNGVTRKVTGASFWGVGAGVGASFCNKVLIKLVESLLLRVFLMKVTNF